MDQRGSRALTPLFLLGLAILWRGSIEVDPVFKELAIVGAGHEHRKSAGDGRKRIGDLALVYFLMNGASIQLKREGSRSVHYDPGGSIELSRRFAGLLAQQHGRHLPSRAE